MDEPKSHLEVLLDNLDVVVSDPQQLTLSEQLDAIAARELKGIERKRKRKSRPDFLPPHLRVIK